MRDGKMGYADAKYESSLQAGDHYPAVAQVLSMQAHMPPSRAEAILSSLVEQRDLLADLRARASDIADRIVGVMPETPPGVGSATSALPNGFLGSVEAEIGHIATEAARLHDALMRFKGAL